MPAPHDKPLTPPARQRNPWLSMRSMAVAGWIFALLLLAALTGTVFHLGDVEHFAALLAAAQPEWLLVAVALQIGTYASEAAIWYILLRLIGHRQPLGGLIPLSLAKLFTDQAIPTGGLSGNIMVVEVLTRRGVPTKSAISALVTGIIVYFLAYLAMNLLALGVLWDYHVVSKLMIIGVALGQAAVSGPPGPHPSRRFRTGGDQRCLAADPSAPPPHWSGHWFPIADLPSGRRLSLGDAAGHRSNHFLHGAHRRAHGGLHRCLPRPLPARAGRVRGRLHQHADPAGCAAGSSLHRDLHTARLYALAADAAGAVVGAAGNAPDRAGIGTRLIGKESRRKPARSIFMPAAAEPGARAASPMPLASEPEPSLHRAPTTL